MKRILLCLVALTCQMLGQGFDTRYGVVGRPLTEGYIQDTAPYLEDMFFVTRATNAVNATPADGRTPTQTRTVVDTESKLSVSGGKLEFAGGKATAEVGDPGIWYPAQSRTLGRIFISSFNATSGTGPYIAFDNNITKGVADDAVSFSGTDMRVVITTSKVVGSVSSATEYAVALGMRASGMFQFLKVSGIWKLMYLTIGDTTSTLYPSVQNYSSAATIDNIRIPKTLYVPTPIASDSFNRVSLGSTDGAGHAEANGGSGLAWQTGANNTWSISGGKLVNTPTTGNNLLANNDFSAGDVSWTKGTGWTISGDGTAHATTATSSLLQAVGTSGLWTRTLFDISSYSSGGYYGAGYVWAPVSKTGNGAYISTGRINSVNQGVTASSSATFYVDNVQALPLSLPDLFATVNAGTPDVIVDVTFAHSGMATSGIQAGVVLNLDSPSNPQNFAIAYFDGAGNVRVEKCIAGTYTSIGGPTAVTHDSAQVLRVVHDSALHEYRVFYNNVAVGMAISESAAALETGTYMGTFSTSSTATFSNFTVWARGNQGQYSQLDTLK